MATTTFRPGDTRAEILRKILEAAGATPPPPVVVIPDPPVATAESGQTATDFQANWNASTGATSYRLDVSTDVGFGSFITGYNNLDVGNVTSASVTGLDGETTYYYRVRAVNSAGTSGNSNVITVDPFYDAEVLDWISRVIGFGSSVPLATKNAANTFMVDLKANNLRTKIKRMNIYAGSTKAACQAPFIKDLGGVSESFSAAITDAQWLYSETGAGGGLHNNAGHILDTGVAANNAAIAIEDYHIGVYKTAEDGAGGRIQMGAGTSGVGALYIYQDTSTDQNFYTMFSLANDIGPVADTSHLGHYSLSRSGTLTAYKNGVSVGSDATPSGLRPTGNIFVHNASLDGSAWPAAASNGTFALYHLGTFLTAGEVSTLYGLVQALQTALTRNV